MPWKGCAIAFAVIALTACGSRSGLNDLLGVASEDAGPLDGGAPPEIPVDSGPAACESATGVVTLASRPVGTWFASLAVDATNVYWLEHGDDESGPGQLLRVSKCGGPVVTIASTPNYPAGLAVDATNAYWSNQSSNLTGSVLRVPLSGGATVTIASGGNDATLAIDDSYVYWTDLDNYVLRTPKAGGPIVTLASGPSPWGSLALTTTFVAWTSAGPTTATLAALPLTGDGVPTTLATSPGEPGDLVIDESNAYWAAYNPGYGGAAAIVRIPLVGGAATTIASGYPRALAIDDTSIYWVDYPNMTGAGAVMRVPKAGGPTVTIQSGLRAPQELAIDATSVYWIDAPNVKMGPQ